MSRPFESIDCAHSRPARYDERTSGPASTPRKPMRSASSLNSTNSCGLTQRSTGRCRGDGRRYCVIVMMSVPASCRSCSAWTTSSGSSPMPRMRFDFVMSPASRAMREHAERAVVAERRPDPLEDARHRLDVVREHLGARVEHLAEQRRIAVEVGREDLDAGVRVLGVDAPHGLGVQPRAAVGQVVAGDAGHGGVAQPHPHDALGDAARLVGVVVGGLAGVDLAEVAAPRALRAADEEGRLAVLPALVDVGAAGLLADGVQALVLHERVQRRVLGPHLGAGLDPLRLALDGRLRRCGSRAAGACVRPGRRRPDAAQSAARRALPQALMRRPPAYSASNAAATVSRTSRGRDIRPDHLADRRDARHP